MTVKFLWNATVSSLAIILRYFNVNMTFQPTTEVTGASDNVVSLRWIMQDDLVFISS